MVGFPTIGEKTEQWLFNWMRERFPQLGGVQAPPAVASPGSGALPGEVKIWPVASAPAGFVLCDGAEYDPAVPLYGPLFAVLGTSQNTGGETAGFFRVPDVRGRVIVGLGTHADVNAVTDNDGLAVASRTPKHIHGLTAVQTSGHPESITAYPGGGLPAFFTIQHSPAGVPADPAMAPWYHEHTLEGSTDSAGIPYQAFSYIIAL